MGGAVVIKDVEEYVQEAEDKINIKDAYKKASTWLNTNTYKIGQWHNKIN